MNRSIPVNKKKKKRNYGFLRDRISKNGGIPVVGWAPRISGIAISDADSCDSEEPEPDRKSSRTLIRRLRNMLPNNLMVEFFRGNKICTQFVARID
jgi:hypothetical protein